MGQRSRANEGLRGAARRGWDALGREVSRLLADWWTLVRPHALLALVLWPILALGSVAHWGLKCAHHAEAAAAVAWWEGKLLVPLLVLPLASLVLHVAVLLLREVIEAWKAPHPEPRATEGPSAEDAILPEPVPEPRDRFVGRQEEMARLAHELGADTDPPTGPRSCCYLHGMPGIGKTWLVEQFYAAHASRFPGGYVHVALEQGSEITTKHLLGRIADRASERLGRVVAPGDLAEALATARTLVLLDNADSEPLAHVCIGCRVHLTRVPLIVCGWHAGILEGNGWSVVPVKPLTPEAAREQLALLLGDEYVRVSGDEVTRLVEEAGGHPLTIALAAGHLLDGGKPADFLERLRRSRFAAPPGWANAAGLDRDASRTLGAALEVAFERLRLGLERRGKRGLLALRRLTLAPRAGFGPSLGAAVAGIDEPSLRDLLPRACKLSLAERLPAAERADVVWRLHALVAEYLRLDLSARGRRRARVRLTVWFLWRVNKGKESDRAARWSEVESEREGLVEWLGGLTGLEAAAAAIAGFDYALAHGPYRAWIAACEAGLESGPGDALRSRLLWRLANLRYRVGDLDAAAETAREMQALARERENERDGALAAGLIADILQSRGELDEALRIRREEELPVYERLGDVRSRAVTMGKIAYVLQSRGELDEALRIRREEELPVYERLGEVRSRAVTMGQIADILGSRGEFDEALRISREEQLPVFERLGDVRSHAVTMGQIADIHLVRGELDEALRIFREELLPVFERLGDVRSRAVTMGKIAYVLQSRGELDEALRIRREEELPVYERLGEVRSRAVTMGQIADILQSRGELDEALRILRDEVLPAFERLGDVRERAVTIGAVAGILQSRGELDEALRIVQEEQLPAVEQLGDAGGLLVCRANMAVALVERDSPGDREEAVGLLESALADAERLRLPREIEQIRRLLAEARSEDDSQGDREPAGQGPSPDPPSTGTGPVPPEGEP